MEKQRLEGGLIEWFERVQAVLLSGFSRMLRCRKELGQFSEVLGGGSEEEFVVCTTWAAQSQSSEAEYTFEVGEEHFHFLPELHRDVVLAGFGDVARDLAGVFMFFAGDLARVGVGAAFCF